MRPRSTTCTAGRLATVLLFVLSSSLVFVLRVGAGQLQHHPAGGRRHGPALSAALVLVADHGVVRNRRHDQFVRPVVDVPGAAPQRSRARDHDQATAVHRGCHDGLWLLTAFLGPQTDEKTLIDFYLKVRPFGPGWTADPQSGRRVSEQGSSDLLAKGQYPAGHARMGGRMRGDLVRPVHGRQLLYGRIGYALAMAVVLTVSGLALIHTTRKLWA